jgi:hypothetical protein
VLVQSAKKAGTARRNSTMKSWFEGAKGYDLTNTQEQNCCSPVLYGVIGCMSPIKLGHTVQLVRMSCRAFAVDSDSLHQP